MDAFKHFLENWKGTVPVDVQNARYAMEGREILRNGKRVKIGLGPKRIKSLLEKYAPGKYEFREVVIFHDKK